MRTSFNKQLAKFIRKQRGELSYAQFAKKMGLSSMTIFRIEKCEIRLSINNLETLVRKLKVKLSDIFPDEC